MALLILFIIVAGFKIGNSSIEGLNVKFRNISEDYMRPGQANGPLGSMPIEAAEGVHLNFID